MKFVEYNKKTKMWQSAIVVLIIIGIVAGFTYYNNNLKNQLKNITEEAERITTEKKSVETQLVHVKNELNTTQEELNVVYNEIDIQLAQIKEYKQEIEKYKQEIEKYKQEIENEEVKWRRRYEEYPAATEAWIAMKTLGWNDIVCAGIMGNFMAETGGRTLNLEWDDDDNGSYGLVQWLGNRRKEINDIYGECPTIKEQVQFMHDELFGVNNVTRQVTDRQLDAIMNADTPEDCAFAFACYYERCAEQYRSIRRGFAKTAYNYFVDL